MTSPRLSVLVLVAAVTLACTSGATVGDQQPAAPQPREAQAVEFPAAGGVTLSGLLFGPADASGVIVMAHAPGGSMDDWVDLAVAAAEQGMAALAFGLRDQGGEGRADAPALAADLEAAVAFVRQEGYAQVGLAGASHSATAVLHVAATDDVAAVVALSPLARAGERAVRARRVAEPVLLVTAKRDQPSRRQTDRLARRLPSAADLDLSGTAHGTDILTQHRAFVDHVVSFFSERLAAGADPAASGAPAEAPAPAGEKSAAPQPVAPPGG